MKKIIAVILIIFISIACEKPVVDTKKEAENVRAIVSKMPGKKVSTVLPAKNTVEVIPKKADDTESGLSMIVQSKFEYPYRNRKDPFYSLLVAKAKMKAEEEEKKKQEEEERKKAELGTNISTDKWGKVKIAAILGNGNGFLVLFGGDDTIYQKNDYIDKDKMIQIVNISKNSVDLALNRNGAITEKRIEMQLEK